MLPTMFKSQSSFKHDIGGPLSMNMSSAPKSDDQHLSMNFSSNDSSNLSSPAKINHITKSLKKSTFYNKNDDDNNDNESGNELE